MFGCSNLTLEFICGDSKLMADQSEEGASTPKTSSVVVLSAAAAQAIFGRQMR